MAPAQLTCRIRVDKARDYDADTEQPENSAVFDLQDCPEVGIKIRTQWAREIVKYFGIIHDSIRPWNFLGRLDGSVKPLPMSVAYTAIKEGQTVIASLVVETYAPGVSRPADAVGESQP